MAAPRRLESFVRGLESVERRGSATIYRVVFGEPRTRLPIRPVEFVDLKNEPRPADERWGWVVAIAAHIALLALFFVTSFPEPSRDTIPEQGMTVDLIAEPDTAMGEKTEQVPAAGEKPSAPISEGLGKGAAILAAPAEVTAEVEPAGLEAKAEAPAPSLAAGPASPPRLNVPATAGAIASGAGSVSPEEARWEGAIIARIEKRKRYPRAAARLGLEDKIMVRLAIARDGKLIRAEIARSKGIAALNEEVMNLVTRASPYPRPPATVAGELVSLVVPVEFLVRKGR